MLFEVDRVRDGRSFCTRQVIASQAGGAILNLIASFQVEEDGADVQRVEMPAGVAATRRASSRWRPRSSWTTA